MTFRLCTRLVGALLLLAADVRAQTATTTRECVAVALPGATEALGVVPAASSLPLRVEDDTDLNYAAVSWQGAAAYVSRSCLSLGFLPPNFIGFRADSLTVLAAWLSASPPAKGEYETTGEYGRRLANWRSTVSVDGRTGDSTFVVTVPLTNDEVSYDADRARMTVRLSQHASLSVDRYLDSAPAPSGHWAYTYFRDASMRNRDTRGRLRRGSWEFTAYLAFPVERYPYETRHPLLDELTFYMPRREARTVAPRLRMALTVRMELPYLSAGVSWGARQETIVGLHATLEKAEVFNPETGKVYARVEAPLRSDDVHPGSEPAPVESGASTSYSLGIPPPDNITVERQPEKVSGNDPEYPDVLRRAGIEGRVVVRAWVGKDGRVKDVQVLRSDDDRFNENTIRAVRSWRFNPAIKDGNPVDVWMTIPVRFRQR